MEIGGSSAAACTAPERAAAREAARTSLSLRCRCGFKGRRCLVVGDVMLDVFERGRATRLAPDAPAPVVTEVRAESSPGGAANVASNLNALGAPSPCSP